MKRVALVIVAVIALVLGFAACQPDDYAFSRSTVISAPPATVYGFVNNMRHQQLWSPWESRDPKMTRTFTGPEEGVGSTYHWKGNDEVGEGEMAITKTDTNKLVDMSLRFIAPWESEGTTAVTLEPEGEGTKATWAMKGTHGSFFAKVFNMFSSIESMVGPDYEKGLGMLKQHAEEAPKKFTTSVGYDGAGVKFTGFAPDAASRDSLLQLAQTKGVKATNEMTLMPGAPADWVDGMNRALLAGSYAHGGATSYAAEKWDNKFVCEEAYEMQAIRGLYPEAAKLDLSLKPVVLEGEEAVCQAEFNALMKEEQIKFSSGSANVDEASFELVKNLAGIFQQCTKANIEVGGHTDADGDDKSNQTLSQQRAAAVVAMLLKEGAAEGHLKAAGYGEKRPIASNKTDAGKAQNRRIEFRIRK